MNICLYLFKIFFLFLLFYIFINNKHYNYKFGENSLCNSILGYTNYISDKNLCDISCFKEPKYNIPNTTYGSCINNIDVIFERIENYISFNENGYINFLNFNKRTGFVENTIHVRVYLYLFVEKTNYLF